MPAVRADNTLRTRVLESVILIALDTVPCFWSMEPVIRIIPGFVLFPVAWQRVFDYNREK